LRELQTTKPARGFDSEAELRAYLGPAPPGYEWHHLIEQTGQFRPDLTITRSTTRGGHRAAKPMMSWNLAVTC
jgi:hypothetical protein